jgi:hypothetical protein
LFIPGFRKKIKKPDNLLAWISFLVSIAGLAVTVFSVVPEVRNINHINIELKEQMRQKGEKDSAIKTIIRIDTIHHTNTVYLTNTVIVHDTIPVFIVIKPENGAIDEVSKVDRDAGLFFKCLEKELKEQKK